MGWERRKEGDKGGEGESRERSSTFSLNFPMIEPSVSGEARDKVDPLNESFKLRPETGSFDKLQEVGVFSYLVYFSFKSHTNGFRFLGPEMAMHSSPKEMGSNAGCENYFCKVHSWKFGTSVDSPEMKISRLFSDS